MIRNVHKRVSYPYFNAYGMELRVMDKVSMGRLVPRSRGSSPTNLPGLPNEANQSRYQRYFPYHHGVQI